VLTINGAALGNMATSPPMSPATTFSAANHDYSVYCSAGVNQITFNLTAAGSGTLDADTPSGHRSGHNIVFQVPALENQAVVLQVPSSGDTYWTRCLPSNFPRITVRTPNTSSAGWYATGDLLGAPDGAGSYAMILDSHATPVWYQVTPSSNAHVHLSAPNVISWAPVIGQGVSEDPGSAFLDYDIGSGTVSATTIPFLPNEFHELSELANGDHIMLASPLVTGKDLSGLGPGFSGVANGTVVDCVIQEVDGSGNPVFTWRASDHITPAEAVLTATPNLAAPVAYNGIQAADIYHCNSVDVDQNAASGDANSGNILVSMRSTSAVYQISRSTGKLLWKLGGNATLSTATDPGETHLTVVNDSHGPISGQHDARYTAPGNISLFDDQTGVANHAARGIQYAVTATTATLNWEYLSPDGMSAGATGSFRRYAAGADNLIGWGFRDPAGFTEVDAGGNVLFDVVLGTPNSIATQDYADKTYRVLKYPAWTLDINAMRTTAGQAPTAGFQSLGGIITAGPAVASTTPHRLDAFARGADNALWHRAWDDTTSAWTAWEPLGGILTSAPAAVATSSTQVDVFVRGADNGLWQKTWNGATWSEWSTQGGILADTPAVATSSSGTLDVFAMGTDNALWHKAYSGTAWGGWGSLDGILHSAPSATSPGAGHLDAYGVGADGNIWHRYFDGSNWVPWENLGGGPALSAPAAASIAAGQVDLFVTGGDGNLERAKYRAGWQAWAELNVSTPDNPAVVARDPGKAIDLFVSSTDRRLLNTVFPP
jgi:hypothetical protein